MKIIDAINTIDDLVTNDFSQKQKIDWLSRFDTMVKQQIIDTHEGGKEVSFSGYDKHTPLETELLVPAPYDDCYLRWLEAQICYFNDEDDRYNNAIIHLNTVLDSFKSFYIQNHAPLNGGRRFLF